MKLSEILKKLPQNCYVSNTHTVSHPEILGISFDSRRAQNGDLFFCKGENFKAEYAIKAIKKGVSAVCFEEGSKYSREIAEAVTKNHPEIAILQVQSIKRAMALCSDIFYRHPFTELKSIAVTGTKGKTSTVQMICGIINQASAFRGAVLNDFLPSDAPSLTTPESPDLYLCARKCADMGYTHIVCEISSQAVKEERIFGIKFDTACFLNFGRDHISPCEHKDESEYFDCKKRLFSACGCAVLNSDCLKTDEIIRYIKDSDTALGQKTEIYTFGFDSPADFRGKNLQKTAEGCVFTLESKKKSLDICVTNDGARSVQNALCASAVGTLIGASEREIFNGVALSRVEGRMERLTSFDKRIEVTIDYAHNKMSFEAVFERAKGLERPITAVFGCPGGKAFCRRKELPEVALRYSDRIILTEDDSGSEGFEAIKNELVSNISLLLKSHPEMRKNDISARISIIPDRKSAIQGALRTAMENNEKRTVLILGKGCEQAMLRENGREFYEGDRNIAKNELDSYDSARESALIFSNARLFHQKLTVLTENESALDTLFFALELLPSDINISVICPEELKEHLRARCFKHGRQEKIFEASNDKLILGDGVRFYLAPRNDALQKTASKIATESSSHMLVYIVSSRGIMLNGEGFVKKLSTNSARLMEKYTKTPYISHLLSALDDGVERCAVLDGRVKNSLVRFVSGLEFSGSEIINKL